MVVVRGFHRSQRRRLNGQLVEGILISYAQWFEIFFVDRKQNQVILLCRRSDGDILKTRIDPRSPGDRHELSGYPRRLKIKR